MYASNVVYVVLFCYCYCNCYCNCYCYCNKVGRGAHKQHCHLVILSLRKVLRAIIKVGRWSPRPVLQQAAYNLQHPASMGFRKYFGCWRTGVLLWFASPLSHYELRIMNYELVGRWSPCPVIQQAAYDLQHPASIGFRKYFGCWRTGHG